MGILNPLDIQTSIRKEEVHNPKTTLVCIENTHNRAGGTIWTPNNIKSISKIVEDNCLKLYMDGARIFNASVALKKDVRKFTRYVDNMMFCLSKGLSCPIGSLVVGNKEFIKKALKMRKILGGGMRQAGIIAAPGIVALEKMVNRLKEDHENAKLLYESIKDISNLVIEEPETNILFLGLQNLSITQMKLAEELAKENIMVYGGYGVRTRMVTNRMVHRDDIDHVATVLRRLLK